MDTTSSPKLSANNAALLAVALSMGAVICGAAAGAASAETSPPTATTETISISDLDLSTADGARAFLKRIDIAAQRACGGDPVRSPLFPREPGHFEQCVREAVSTAVRQADEPMVAAAHTEALTLASR
jgi:UrcA family protein